MIIFSGMEDPNFLVKIDDQCDVMDFLDADLSATHPLWYIVFTSSKTQRVK